METGQMGPAFDVIQISG